MTEDQLLFQGGINHHCRFTLTNGTTIQGVIITSPTEGHGSYCFIPTSKMREFKELESIGDKEEIKKVIQSLSFEQIISFQQL